MLIEIRLYPGAWRFITGRNNIFFQVAGPITGGEGLINGRGYKWQFTVFFRVTNRRNAFEIFCCSGSCPDYHTGPRINLSSLDLGLCKLKDFNAFPIQINFVSRRINTTVHMRHQSSASSLV